MSIPVIGTFGKWMLGAVGTMGLIVYPIPDRFFSPSLLSQWVARNEPTEPLPSHASATEPLTFASSSALNESVVRQVDRAQSAPIPLEMWSPAAVALSPKLAGSDAERFQQLMRYAMERSLYQKPLSEIVQAIATQLLGSTYQANLLDQSSQETLLVSLTRFDCVLFVETVLALAQGVAQRDYSYPTFTSHLQAQRYRSGVLDGYCSRLHYFSEWIADNQKRGHMFNIVPSLGGVSSPKVLNFMSTHRGSYPRMANDQTYQCIRDMEAVNPFNLSYIPKAQVQRIYSQLQPGDVVAITTDVPGLDVTHTGLVYRNPNGGVGLIHAAPERGVIISPDLQHYVNRVEDAVGVLIARPVDPRQRI